ADALSCESESGDAPCSSRSRVTARARVRVRVRPDSRLQNLQFVSRDVVRADLPIAVQPEAKPFVERTQPRTLRITVQTQISLAQCARTIDGPFEERRRYSLPRKRTP